MSADNFVSITGNLTRDPELRFTPGGQAVAGFGVAVNRRWQNKQTQEWEEKVSFFDVTCWGTLAENAAQTLTKGSRALVIGRLDQSSWDKDGEKKTKIEIVADSVSPDLRWATAQVVRNPREERSSGGDSGSRPVARAKSAGSVEEPF